MPRASLVETWSSHQTLQQHIGVPHGHLHPDPHLSPSQWVLVFLESPKPALFVGFLGVTPTTSRIVPS